MTNNDNHLRAITAAQKDLVEAERSVDALRAYRDDLIRLAVNDGVSRYRIAQETGLSQTVVGRIAQATEGEPR